MNDFDIAVSQAEEALRRVGRVRAFASYYPGRPDVAQLQARQYLHMDMSVDETSAEWQRQIAFIICLWSAEPDQLIDFAEQLTMEFY